MTPHTARVVSAAGERMVGVSDEWTGTLAWDVTPDRPGKIEKGSRLVVRTIEGDTSYIVDEVSEPDEDGVISATAHVESQTPDADLYLETHETAPQPEG